MQERTKVREPLNSFLFINPLHQRERARVRGIV